LLVRPNRPEVQPEGGVEDVIDDGDGQDDPRDPVVGDPGKLDTYLGKEGSQEQREHGGRHDPVEKPSPQRVSGDTLGNAGGDSRGGSGRIARMQSGGFRPVSPGGRSEEG